MSSRVWLVVVALLLLCGDHSLASGRHKRIVGGEKARPPPAGASEKEDIVENPFLTNVQPTKVPTTTKRPTSPRPLDDGPIVFLRRGRREARVEGVKTDDYYQFLGVRYAVSPVGDLRFQRPRQFKPDGDLNATAFAPPCPQTIGKRLVGSEDCLFLNVYTPEIPKDSSSKRYPVLFWIHGGGFRRGSGSLYGPKHLVKKGLVVVTIQYRLGTLGFLSTNRTELSGNAGMFDIAASLRWVRRYIDAFGGDRNHIITSGQGCGASAAQMLAFNQFTRGWIKGVFAMSGSSISSFAVDNNPEGTAKDVSAIQGCDNIVDPLSFVRCMQKLPLEVLIKGDDTLQDEKLKNDNKAKSYLTSISKLLNPGPTTEGKDDLRFLPFFLTSSPQDFLKSGDFANVPLLTGVTKDETSTSAKGGGIATQLLGGVEASQELLESIITELLHINTEFIGGDLVAPVVKSLTSASGLLVKGVTSSLSGVASTVDKIIEVTTDALFNLPAFLTSGQWSKQGKAYMYSFEHKTKTTTADDFLQESPLTEQNKPVEGVGHGDDLIYLFEYQSVEGLESEATNLTEPDDQSVRDTFTDMVAEFARSGEPKLNGESVTPFTTEEGNYMVIDTKPSVQKGFRKCQMGLWAGLKDVLNSAECTLQLGDVGKTLFSGNVAGALTKPLTGALGKGSNGAQNLSPLGALSDGTSGGVNKNPLGALSDPIGNGNSGGVNKNPISGLGGLGGQNKKPSFGFGR